MKARFFKNSETYHELGIEFVPETKEEELLLELFMYGEPGPLLFRFDGSRRGGSAQYADGQPRFVQNMRGVIARKLNDKP